MPELIKHRITTALEETAALNLLRQRDEHSGAQGMTITVGGRALQNFTSNDYLGLANDRRILDAVRSAVGEYGFGSGAAALLSGRSSLHAALEARLAERCGFEAALIFSSGYLANVGTLQALLGKRDACAHDRLNHASLIDGVLASGATHRRYKHASPQAAAELLSGWSDRDARCLATESVFSMDGDSAPLEALCTIAREHGAWTYIDDAHGFGVTGMHGLGASEMLDERARQNTVMMLTFGKSLGSAGAAVLADGETIEYLVQRARTYVFDTAPPPANAAAALEALDIIENVPAQRDTLRANIARLRSAAAAAGVELMPSETPIQPVLVGADDRALEIAARVRARGFYVRAVRPPTVPRGTARIRLTLSAAHDFATIDELVAALAEALVATRTEGHGKGAADQRREPSPV